MPEWAGSCKVCTKLPITTDFLCNWTPFRVITTFDFLAEINKLFFYQGSEKERRIGCAQKLLSVVFLSVEGMGNSHLNSFILVTRQCSFFLLIHKRLFIDIPQDQAAALQKHQFHWSILFPRETSFISHFPSALQYIQFRGLSRAVCLLGGQQKQSLGNAGINEGQPALYSSYGTSRD